MTFFDKYPFFLSCFFEKTIDKLKKIVYNVDNVVCCMHDEKVCLAVVLLFIGKGNTAMMIKDMIPLLDATVLTGEEMLDKEVASACGSDMMSDVLAFVKEQAVLLTGLCNPQTVRTAMMMDIICIVFIRGKVPPKEVVELAQEAGIVLLCSKERMFPACGKLYAGGLRGGLLNE